MIFLYIVRKIKTEFWLSVISRGIPDIYLLSYSRHCLVFIMLTSRYMNQLTSKSGGVGGKPLFMAGCQLINSVGMMEIGKSEFSHHNNN